MQLFKMGGLFLISFSLIHSMQKQLQASILLTAQEKDFLRAAIENDFDAIQHNVTNGVNINVQDKEGECALYLSCLYDNFRIAEFLVQQKNIVTNVTSKTAPGKRKPLHFVCSDRHFTGDQKAISIEQRTHLITLLLKAGAQANVHNYLGETPLDDALDLPFAQPTRLLIDAGASLIPLHAHRKPYLVMADDQHTPDHVRALLMSPRITIDDVHNALKNNKEQRQKIWPLCKYHMDAVINKYESPPKELFRPFLNLIQRSAGAIIAQETFNDLEKLLPQLEVDLHEQIEPDHIKKIHEYSRALKKYQESYNIFVAYYRTQLLIERHKKAFKPQKNKMVPRILSLPPDLLKRLPAFAAQ